MMQQPPQQLPPQSLPVVIERQVSQEALRPTLDEGYYEAKRMVDQLHEQIRQKQLQQKQQEHEELLAFFKDTGEKLKSQLVEVYQKNIAEYKKETDKRISELEIQLLRYTGKHDVLDSTLKKDISNIYPQLDSLNTRLGEAKTTISLNNIDRETSETLAKSKFQSITTDLENIRKELTKFDELQSQLKIIYDKEKDTKQSSRNYQALKTVTESLAESIKGLQIQNSALSRRMDILSQTPVSADSGATFMKYIAMAGILALFIGTVTTSAKIMAVINHLLNQKAGL